VLGIAKREMPGVAEPRQALLGFAKEIARVNSMPRIFSDRTVITALFWLCLPSEGQGTHSQLLQRIPIIDTSN